MRVMTRHNGWWALAVSACAIYLLAALYQLNQPWLNYD